VAGRQPCRWAQECGNSSNQAAQCAAYAGSPAVSRVVGQWWGEAQSPCCQRAASQSLAPLFNGEVLQKRRRQVCPSQTRTGMERPGRGEGATHAGTAACGAMKCGVCVRAAVQAGVGVQTATQWCASSGLACLPATSPQ